MTQDVDYYAILGVARDASPAVIRSAYRRLAKQHHPDRSSGSEVRMIELNKAYEVLGDPRRRVVYDRPAGPRPTARSGRPDSAESPAAATSGLKSLGGAPLRAPGPLARRKMANEEASAVLDFGRYKGWSLAEVARCDPDYLDWLSRTPAGRSLAAKHSGHFQEGRTSARATASRSPQR